MSKFHGIVRQCVRTTRNDFMSQRTRELSTKQAIDREYAFTAHNYRPLPVVLSKGQGKIVCVSILGVPSHRSLPITLLFLQIVLNKILMKPRYQ